MLFSIKEGLRAIDTGGIAAACDLNLNPVKLRAAHSVKNFCNPPGHDINFPNRPELMGP